MSLFRLALQHLLTGMLIALPLSVVAGDVQLVGGEKPVINISPPIRAVHIVLAPSGETAQALEYSSAERLIKQAAAAGFNAVILQIANSIDFEAELRLSRRGAWPKVKLIDLAKVAKVHGIELIPEIKLLSHQEKLFQQHFPNLMFNATTYDPQQEETYRIVFALLDEVIEAIHPKAIHIGHDETIGWLLKRKVLPNKTMGLKHGEQALPAELFLMDVLRIRGYLKQRGVETWMWGDMLISPEEFPEMRAWELHGGHVGNYGYGKPLRDQLPRDIVICDWHYFDEQAEFSSLRAFQQEGFRVLGATWKKEKTIRNFSRYAAQHGADGMIATTWFHVPRKEWDVVDRIIKNSGETFMKDFPDAK